MGSPNICTIKGEKDQYIILESNKYSIFRIQKGHKLKVKNGL